MLYTPVLVTAFRAGDVRYSSMAFPGELILQGDCPFLWLQTNLKQRRDTVQSTKSIGDQSVDESTDNSQGGTKPVMKETPSQKLAKSLSNQGVIKAKRKSRTTEFSLEEQSELASLTESPKAPKTVLSEIASMGHTVYDMNGLPYRTLNKVGAGLS